MKTERELNWDILRVTMTLEEKFPELIKYLGEMPVKISDTAGHEADIQNLYDYYRSLSDILNSYTVTHVGTIK